MKALRVQCDVDLKGGHLPSELIVEDFGSGEVLLESRGAVVPSRRDLRRLHAFIGRKLKEKKQRAKP